MRIHQRGAYQIQGEGEWVTIERKDLKTRATQRHEGGTWSKPAELAGAGTWTRGDSQTGGRLQKEKP